MSRGRRPAGRRLAGTEAGSKAAGSPTWPSVRARETGCTGAG